MRWVPLALGALLLVSGYAAAQGAQADLGMRSLQVDGKPRAGGQVTVEAVVVNQGPSQAAAFTLSFLLDDEAHPLNGTNATSQLSYPVDGAAFSVEQPEGACQQQFVGAPLAVGCALRAVLSWWPNATQGGAHSLLVQVAPTAGSDPVPGNDSAAQPVFVEVHDLTLTLDARDAHAKSVPPGDIAPYRAALANQGNVPESVALGVRSDNWTGGSAVPSSLSIAPGATVPVLALVASPGDASAAQSARATLTARNFSTEIGNASLDLPVTSAQADASAAYGFTADAGANETLVGPGSAADLTVRLRNTGTTEDAVRARLSGGGAGWTLGLPAAFAVVPPGTGMAGELVVRAAANASVAPGSAVDATLTLTSVNRPDTQLQVPLTFRASAPDLALGAVTFDEPAVYSGDPVGVRVEVRNLGDLPLAKPARVSLAASRGADSFPLDDELVNDVGPGDLRIVRLAWNTTGYEGDYDLTVLLDASNDVTELHEDNNALVVPVTVRTHGLQVSAPGARSVAPGQSVDYQGSDAFRVRNLGNAVEQVRLDLGTPHGWANASRLLVLGPGQEQSVPLSVQVPTRPGTLLEELTATATLVNRTLTAASGSTQLSILDTEAPVLVQLTAPDFVELGTPAAFRATLTDAVGVRSATLTLRQPDGTLQSAALGAQGPDAWGADVVLAQPGPVSYWLTAVDATPANNTLDTRGNPGALLVGVRTAPLVELVDPHDGASVRPGAQLRLRVTDVHGIGSVAVRDGTRSFEVQEPYSIDTTGWDEGLHTVTVTARNRFGNAASLTFNVTLDATPPVVRDARADPARPAPGQAFTVSASASGDAARATVQVRRQGQLLREVPADLGSQVASASLSLDAGSYVLTVRVEDAAGNPASVDLPLTVGSGAPGLEAWAVLAALGAAAWARRR